MLDGREIGAKINHRLIFLGRKRDDKSSHSIDGRFVGNEDELLLEAEEYCIDNVDYGEFSTFFAIALLPFKSLISTKTTLLLHTFVS